MKPPMENHRTQAIVLGASLGGLMTARVLSKHFEKVLLIEKDEVHRQPESRKGQPHTRHLHGLLPRGFLIMTHYFPDLPQALTENDAVIEDFGEKMVWKTYGGYRKPIVTGIRGVTVSRPLLEHLVRERVLALPNVELMDHTTVKKWTTTTDQKRVTGVVVSHKGIEENRTANLVVDVTGRNSQSSNWLKAFGYEAPSVSEVKVHVGYATRLYKRDPNHSLSKSWIIHSPKAPMESRFGGILPMEGNRWIMTVGGWHGDVVPLDEKGYLAYVKDLPMPELYHIVCQSEPISEIIPYKFLSSLRRHYEKLTRFPLGYLVLGDAVSSFNPIYGQGMTSASLQAVELDKVLTQHISEAQLATTFFKKVSKVVDVCWNLSVGEDFRFPETEGPKPVGNRFLNKYISWVHQATLTDAVVCKAFLKVLSLMEPPTTLFYPRILWRVLRAGYRSAGVSSNP
jgi:2-polyprenyl-6-methoxyphenol hydroxylase-like FAD-dependent oxidoreductase